MVGIILTLSVDIWPCICWVGFSFFGFCWPLWILGKCSSCGCLVGSASAGQLVAERNKGGLGEKMIGASG